MDRLGSIFVFPKKTSKWAIFLIAVVAIFIFPTKAISSNVHEMMTSAEIFETFGTTDNFIPDYQVFSVALPGSRRRRNADEGFSMTVEINNTEIKLNFEPSKGQLVSKYTPVWLAVTDENAYKNIRYDPQLTALTDIGEFKMYHDLANEAAVTVYDDPDEGAIIEGVVTSDFGIKSLPKRLMNEVLRQGEHFLKTPEYRKRSLDNLDMDEVMSYYALYKIAPAPKDAKRSVALDPTTGERIKRQTYSGRNKGRKVPDVLYPEILVVLDHNAIRNQSLTQALRFTVAFWNAADMVYSALTQPSVRLNIAGIIIGADDTATPYIAKDASVKILADGASIPDMMAKYFYEEQTRFPLDHYDIVLAMTTIDLCLGNLDPCEHLLGIANFEVACSSASFRSRNKAIESMGITHYSWDFGGVDTATHEAAHIFGVEHDEGYSYGGENNCEMDEGYAMAAAAQFNHQSFKWSRCSKDYFRNYFKYHETTCLDNKPLWMKPVDQILPGRWLTIDGQCRNAGMEKACKLPKIPICLAKGCQAEGSSECVPNERQTLPGTKCGDQMICSPKNNCEKD